MSRLPAIVLLLGAAVAPLAKAQPQAITPAEFEEIRTQLAPPDQAWSRIFWHSSLTEARLRAVEEKKPLLIRASWGTLHGVC